MLQDLACQDAMWSRAVAADAPTPEESSASADSTTAAVPGKEQYVQEFSPEAPARVQSQLAALDALASERARHYRTLCKQVMPLSRR